MTNLRGEPKTEGPDLCFRVRGEPDELLGESGGVLPAGNMEGNELLVAAFGLDNDPETFKGPPALALLSKDFTCIARKERRLRPQWIALLI